VLKLGDPSPRAFGATLSHKGRRLHRVRGARVSYLIASGLTGDPTAPVIGIAGATNMNS
jgi:hypothetical protein